MLNILSPIKCKPTQLNKKYILKFGKTARNMESHATFELNILQ